MALINDHRQWLYKGGVETGKIFEKGETIPDGWFDTPNGTKWDNKPLPPDQWPRKVEPEPAPVYISEPTPLEHEPEPAPEPEQSAKFDPFPVKAKDLMTLKKHELVSILEGKGVAAEPGLDIAKLRAMARKVYKK